MTGLAEVRLGTLLGLMVGSLCGPAPGKGMEPGRKARESLSRLVVVVACLLAPLRSIPEGELMGT